MFASMMYYGAQQATYEVKKKRTKLNSKSKKKTELRFHNTVIISVIIFQKKNLQSIFFKLKKKFNLLCNDPSSVSRPLNYVVKSHKPQTMRQHFLISFLQSHRLRRGYCFHLHVVGKTKFEKISHWPGAPDLEFSNSKMNF